MPALIFTRQAVFLSSLQFLIFSVRVLNASTGAVWIKSCSLGRLSFMSDLKLKDLWKTKGGSVNQINSGRVYSSYWGEEEEIIWETKTVMFTFLSLSCLEDHWLWLFSFPEASPLSHAWVINTKLNWQTWKNCIFTLPLSSSGSELSFSFYLPRAYQILRASYIWTVGLK